MGQSVESIQKAGRTKARPLDARLARRLVRPLCHTPVKPNHLTTLRLALGLAAAAFLTAGDLGKAIIGAVIFTLSNLVDHTDGELARVSGNSSRLGHWYDLVSDGLIHVLLFTALGYGVAAGPFNGWAIVLGLVAGVAVAFIFTLHTVMEADLGKSSARLPAARWFEMEDVLYLFPLVAVFDVRLPFLIAAAVGAPAFALWLTWYFARIRGPRTRENRTAQ